MSQILVQVPQNADGSIPDVLVQFVPYVAPTPPSPPSQPAPPAPPTQTGDADIGAWQTGDPDTLPENL